ncbi:MAG: D-alanyl-D-alanine carboxypeptidase/D-alanyl-D-alanine-endopeptidase [Chitinophagaceae bacterium]
MKLKLFYLLLVVFSISKIKAQSFAKLDSAFSTLKKKNTFQHASISFSLIDIQNRKTLYEHNATEMLAPASTLKTYTTATALDVLGQDFTYTTRITFQGTISKQTAVGNINIYPSGDPSFGSDRFKETNAQKIIQQIISSIKKLNITKFYGDIVFKPSTFESYAINTHWLAEDIGNYYGAGYYPFNWRENKFELNIAPYDKTFVATSNTANLNNNEFCFEIKHTEGATTEEVFAYVESKGSCHYVLKGNLNNKEKSYNLQLARLHPDEDFKKELVQNIQKEISFFPQKIKLSNEIEKPLINIQSPPLSTLVYWCNQKSLNLYAEAFCKTISQKLFKKGTWDLGTTAMKRFASNQQINVKKVVLYDGSGLAPDNRINTQIMASLLQSYTKEKYYTTFYESLPSINGLIMKSGYIGGTRSYAGYITLKDSTKASFAFIVHNYSCTPKQAKIEMFKILDMLK